MANLAYIEGDVHIFGLDHFVHGHFFREEPDYSISMLYGRKAIQLPNTALRLYSCESLTLQFDRMGEVVTIPLTVTPSLASELEPPSLPGTLTGMLIWSSTSVVWLTKLSTRWRGSVNSSDGWMTLQMFKQRCKLPSTRTPA
jgi:hypothetical protein